MSVRSSAMKASVMPVLFKFHRNASVERMNTPLLAVAREKNVAKFVVLLSTVKSINVKEDATKVLVPHAQKILRE